MESAGSTVGVSGPERQVRLFPATDPKSGALRVKEARERSKAFEVLTAYGQGSGLLQALSFEELLGRSLSGRAELRRTLERMRGQGLIELQGSRWRLRQAGIALLQHGKPAPVVVRLGKIQRDILDTLILSDLTPAEVAAQVGCYPHRARVVLRLLFDAGLVERDDREFPGARRGGGSSAARWRVTEAGILEYQRRLDAGYVPGVVGPGGRLRPRKAA